MFRAKSVVGSNNLFRAAVARAAAAPAAAVAEFRKWLLDSGTSPPLRYEKPHKFIVVG